MAVIRVWISKPSPSLGEAALLCAALPPTIQRIAGSWRRRSASFTSQGNELACALEVIVDAADRGDVGVSLHRCREAGNLNAVSVVSRRTVRVVTGTVGVVGPCGVHAKNEGKARVISELDIYVTSGT
jgi:hypothetical protein